jgi:hypothetical protein
MAKKNIYVFLFENHSWKRNKVKTFYLKKKRNLGNTGQGSDVNIACPKMAMQILW